MPKLAVLLPARDAARTVRAAAVSMLRQSVRDLALVCVDDGSTDGTSEVLAKLAERDARVRVVRTEGVGIARALMAGLAHCDAPFVARMDADDLSHPRRLEAELAALDADPALAAVGCRVRLFPRREVKPGMARYAAWLNSLVTSELCARDLFVEAPLVHPAALIRRDALLRAGGWRDGLFPEDYDLWLRLASNAPRFRASPVAEPSPAPPPGGALANVPRTLFAWRESPGRLTRVDPRYDLSRHVALKCFHLARGFLAGHGEVALWGAGETGRAFADALAKEGIGVALFVDVDARKVGRTLRGAPVIGVSEVERARGRLPLLVAVGAPGARDLIRAELGRRGFAELADYVCVA